MGYLHFGGSQDAVSAGSLIRLTSRTGIFRVLATLGDHLTLMSRDAQQPGRLRVPTKDVLEHKRQRRPVYSTSSYTFPVKSWGEPPEGPGGVLILDQRLSPTHVRALSALECWRLQGLQDSDADFIATSVRTPADEALSRIAGNATEAHVAAAIVDRTLARSRHVDAIAAHTIARAVHRYLTPITRITADTAADHNRAGTLNREQRLKRARATPISHYVKSIEAMEDMLGVIPDSHVAVISSGNFSTGADRNAAVINSGDYSSGADRPVEMCNELRERQPHRFREAEGNKHVFVTANGTVFHKAMLQHLLKNAATKANSLRAGEASATYHNGFSAEEIQRRGRWVSDVWKVYIKGNSEGAEAYDASDVDELNHAPRPPQGGRGWREDMSAVGRCGVYQGR